MVCQLAENALPPWVPAHHLTRRRTFGNYHHKTPVSERHTPDDLQSEVINIYPHDADIVDFDGFGSAGDPPFASPALSNDKCDECKRLDIPQDHSPVPTSPSETDGDTLIPPKVNPHHLHAALSWPFIQTTPQFASSQQSLPHSASDSILGRSDDEKLKTPTHRRICYYLIATVVVGVAASLGIALWWGLSRGDVSAGFTMGSYVVALVALVVAVFGAVHWPRCRCWSRKSEMGLLG
ncbi:hypothetical protein GGS21DRAFT_486882 [Xylaria nigripes]|nr:hypothetical protein GGS21DRAFT_486882 [Xylaria nigripes]